MKTLTKISISTITFLALCLPLASCVNTSMRTMNSAPDVPVSDEISADYKIGPEDVLEVSVWRNESLSKTVTVRPDGKISLPLIGDVQVAGQTAEQVREAIAAQLKGYYKEPPQVSLIVLQTSGHVIYIMGEVQRPAQYQVKRGTTFLQAIALAGGFTPFASTNDIVVLRKSNENNNQTAIAIRSKDIFSGRNLGSNILLKPGDTIVVR
jgi:polysaccharide biosynthesis/export protein